MDVRVSATGTFGSPWGGISLLDRGKQLLVRTGLALVGLLIPILKAEYLPIPFPSLFTEKNKIKFIFL